MLISASDPAPELIMTRRLLPVLALLALAGCSDEPENLQTKADNLSRSLETKANLLENEASNGVDAAIAPLDNEANALLAQADNSAAPADNAAGNTGQ
jgi:uncharacterized protein YcfL